MKRVDIRDLENPLLRYGWRQPGLAKITFDWCAVCAKQHTMEEMNDDGERVCLGCGLVTILDRAVNAA